MKLGICKRCKKEKMIIVGRELCQSCKVAENREKKLKEYKKREAEYREKNKDKISKYHHEYYEEHKDKIIDNAKKYYAEHKEEIKQRLNPEKERIRWRTYKQNHKDKVKEWNKLAYEKRKMKDENEKEKTEL